MTPTPTISEAARDKLRDAMIELIRDQEMRSDSGWEPGVGDLADEYIALVVAALDSAHPAPCKECGGVKPWCELEDRITNYFGNGGLFNPEMMEHQKVSQLLMDVLDAIRNSGVARAHPAPKEGETPETDAEFSAHPIYYRSSAGNHFPVVQLVLARSLELRLSEAKREITQLKNNDTNLTDMLNDLRSQLKTANELLREAETRLTCSLVRERTEDPEFCDYVRKTVQGIRTHLNQQSK